jgi:hypothetical protein
MENKINLIELLKDCPKGMELDCTVFKGLEFDHIDENNETYPIICRVKTEWGSYNIHTFTKYGCYSTAVYSKCVIFPKGKTTWGGLQRPFKDGDIVADDTGWIGITSGGKINSFIPTYCVIKPKDEFEAYFDKKETWQFSRLATEEEKQKLFQAIKDNGYKWNAETKTLEKLVEPNFKVDDKIKLKGKDEFGIITQVSDCFYTIKWKNNTHCWPIKKQDDWELVPNKFDINTLVPFESRVLVREDKTDVWRPTFYGFFHQHSKRFYTTSCGTWLMCIPYNENTKHLTGTTNDCDNFYKTWEK